MLERLHDKYFTKVMRDSASLKCYTVEGASIVKQLNNSGSCIKDANSIDEEIPTSTKASERGGRCSDLLRQYHRLENLVLVTYVPKMGQFRVCYRIGVEQNLPPTAFRHFNTIVHCLISIDQF